MAHIQGYDQSGRWIDTNHCCPDCYKSLPLPQWANKKCPKCAKIQPNKFKKFVEAEKVCSECQTRCSNNDKFCTKCGVKL